MNKAFIFIKLKGKRGIRKVNVPHVKRVNGGFLLKKSSGKPFFIVPELKRARIKSVKTKSL